MTEETPRAGLTSVEIALLDAIKSVSLVLIAIAPGAARSLATSFAHQRDDKIRTGQPDAAAALELLRRFVAGPELQEAVEQARRLLTEPPAGRG